MYNLKTLISPMITERAKHHKIINLKFNKTQKIRMAKLAILIFLLIEIATEAASSLVIEQACLKATEKVACQDYLLSTMMIYLYKVKVNNIRRELLPL
jgi:uncharacterized protein (UPF0216 family)